MNCKIYLSSFLFCALAPAFGAAEQAQLDLSQPYLLLERKDPYVLQNELNQAGSAGYQVSATWTAGKMLVLLKVGPPAPREFRVVTAEDLALLQADLTENARLGFRLVPAGVFRSRQEIVLLLERTADSAPHYTYVVKAFSTDYDLVRVTELTHETPHPAGRMNREPLRVALRHVTAEHYEVVGLVSRSRDWKRDGQPVRNVQHILIGEKTSGPTLRTTEEQADALHNRYRLIVHGDTTTLQAELSQLASQGYRLLLTSPVAIPELVGIMERIPDPEATYEYQVLETNRVSTMRKELNQAAARGFRPHPRAIFREPLLVVMEREPGRKPAPEYSLYAKGRTTTLREAIFEAAANGYSVVGASGNDSLVVMEEGVEPVPPPLQQLPTTATAELRSYTIDLRGQEASKIQEQLDEATNRGYCITGSSGIDPDVVNLEMNAEPSERCEYRILTTDKVSSLENELNQAGAEGFRLIPHGFNERDTFVGHSVQTVLERTQGSAKPYNYRALCTSRISTLQGELKQSSAAGFRVVPFAVLERTPYVGCDLLVVAEKTPDSPPPCEYLVLSTQRASTLDEEILEALLEGYEVLVQLTRGGRGPLAEPYVALLERPVTVPSATSAGDRVAHIEDLKNRASSSHDEKLVEEVSNPPLTITSTGRKPSWIQKQLNKAAALGYCFKSDADDDPSVVTLEKRAESRARCEHRVLSTTKVSTMQKELNEAASEGFQLVHAAVPKTKTASGSLLGGLLGAQIDEVMAVVEKTLDAPASYDYLVLSTQIRGTLDMEIEKTTEEGYELRRVLQRSDDPFADSYVAFLERPISASRPESADQPTDTVSIDGYDIADVQRRVNEAAAKGYRLTSVSTFERGAFAASLLLKMEKGTDPTTGCEYQLLSNKKLSTLQKKINKAAAKGFRLLPNGILVKAAAFSGYAVFVVLEKSFDPLASYQYLVVSTEEEFTLETEIAQARSEGYEFVARVSRAGWVGMLGPRPGDHVAFLERPGPK